LSRKANRPMPPNSLASRKTPTPTESFSSKNQARLPEREAFLFYLVNDFLN
jgi:hypothetical protein